MPKNSIGRTNGHKKFGRGRICYLCFEVILPGESVVNDYSYKLSAVYLLDNTVINYYTEQAFFAFKQDVISLL